VTTYTFAQLPKWGTKVTKIGDAIVKTATGDMLADIEVVPGINRGGSRVRGTIPRDIGALANSLQSTLYGTTAMSAGGADSHTLIAGAMKAGDVAKFSWGGGVAPYAPHVHYGANGVPGTFWRDAAAGKWPGYVAAAVAKAKAEIRG
jgi:20S proteasome alpha/beta subunit